MRSAFCALALLAGSGTACQRAGITARPTTPALPTVLVVGAVYASDDSIPLVNFSAVFSRTLPDLRTETVTDSAMPATGRYRVRLAAGQTYLIALNYGHCNVEQQEFAVPAQGAGMTTKNFYLSYPDTTYTDHSHCLRGLKRYR
jgi:hypothetical protein